MGLISRSRGDQPAGAPRRCEAGLGGALDGVHHREPGTAIVVYASSQHAARKAAAAFLAMEPDEVSKEDISDVLGELANIVGGNVKAMLPAGCFLSLPHGGAGTRHGLVLPDGGTDQRPVRHLGRRAGVHLDVAER